MHDFGKIAYLVILTFLVKTGISYSTVGFQPRANPLPKPVSIDWALDLEDGNTALPIYFVPESSLVIVCPENEVLKLGVNRSIHKMYEEKWVPQALTGPPPKYKKFPSKIVQQEIGQTEKLNNTNFSAYHLPLQYPMGIVNGQEPRSYELREISKITITVEDCDIDLQHGINESYTLEIYSTIIEISSATIWGTLHALATLEQLVEWDTESERILIERGVYIKDSPLFPHREVLIDTARNFYSVESLLRQIDTMALAKLNVFHWHIVDTQSWPIDIKAYPNMILDAYSKKEVYQQSDVEFIVRYGYLRGVRVIPEIDMPAHSNSGWRQVNPEIISCGDSFWNGYGDDWQLHTALQPTPGHLDILHPDTLPIVQNVYNELSALFSENFFHIGLDEITPNCYNYSEHISEWFRENSTRTYHDLVQHWVNSILPIFLQARPNRRLIMWEDVILSKEAGVYNLSSSSVIIQSWMGGKENIRTLLRKGYDVVVSSSDFFYLDCGVGGFFTNDPRYNEQNDPTPGIPSFNYHGPGGSWCAPYKTWQRIYNYDFNYDLDDDDFVYDKSKILGASVALWSEQSDSSVVDQKIWPRAASLAELLWSGNRNSAGQKRTTEFAQRIINFRERLVQRGVSPEVIIPRYCVTRPHSCDLYMNQSILG